MLAWFQPFFLFLATTHNRPPLGLVVPKFFSHLMAASPKSGHQEIRPPPSSNPSSLFFFLSFLFSSFLASDFRGKGERIFGHSFGVFPYFFLSKISCPLHLFIGEKSLIFGFIFFFKNYILTPNAKIFAFMPSKCHVAGHSLVLQAKS